MRVARQIIFSFTVAYFVFLFFSHRLYDDGYALQSTWIYPGRRLACAFDQIVE